MISAVGGGVKAWDALSGKLIWGNEFNDGETRDLEVAELESGKEGRAVKDAVLLSGSTEGVVRRLNGNTGDVMWEFRDDR